MPGPTPITATHRLKMLYTVSLFQHKQQNYCSVVGGVGPSGWDLQPRVGFAPVDVQSAVDRFFTRMAPFYNPAFVTFNGWLLEVRSGTTFSFLAAGTTAVVPTGAGLFEIANGLCLSGKDTTQLNFPAYVYEGNFGSATKIQAAGGLGASARALMNYFWDVDGLDTDADAWSWRISRGSKHATRWIAWVTDTNEKLRRIRRIK